MHKRSAKFVSSGYHARTNHCDSGVTDVEVF
jgi:hypothetical protein